LEEKTMSRSCLALAPQPEHQTIADHDASNCQIDWQAFLLSEVPVPVTVIEPVRKERDGMSVVIWEERGTRMCDPGRLIAPREVDLCDAVYDRRASGENFPRRAVVGTRKAYFGRYRGSAEGFYFIPTAG
jgi:hypothetical protein